MWKCLGAASFRGTDCDDWRHEQRGGAEEPLWRSRCAAGESESGGVQSGRKLRIDRMASRRTEAFEYAQASGC